MKYLLFFLFLPVLLYAVPVTLQNATATYSQSGYTVDKSIDGVIDSYGWAVNAIPNHSAAWETVSNVTASKITFTMHQLYNLHWLGRFLFSVTSDSRSTFADGLLNNGDVTANWIALENPTITLPSGMNYSVLEDKSILISATSLPGTGVYYVEYSLPIANITGIRLDTLPHSSLTNNGPGLGYNGNFVLSELVVDASGTFAIPEPASFFLLGFFIIFRYLYKK